MSDLIDREDAIDAISKLPVKVDDLGYTWMIANDVLKQIDDIPSAEPEQKSGHWIVHLYKLGRERYECSECTGRCDLEYNFCPHCGARMRSEE